MRRVDGALCISIFKRAIRAVLIIFAQKRDWERDQTIQYPLSGRPKLIARIIIVIVDILG